MASAVRADRFWQIDLGVNESIVNERRAVRHWRTALFVFVGKPKKRRRVTFPLIRSKRPGSLRLDSARIFEIIP